MSRELRLLMWTQNVTATCRENESCLPDRTCCNHLPAANKAVKKRYLQAYRENNEHDAKVIQSGINSMQLLAVHEKVLYSEVDINRWH